MEVTGPGTVSIIAMVAAAIANPDVAAWLFREHESKVFRAHGWGNITVYLILANQFFHDVSTELSHLRMIQGRRIYAREFEVMLALECVAGMGANRLHALFNKI